jgi:hypothetical protein
MEGIWEWQGSHHLLQEAGSMINGQAFQPSVVLGNNYNSTLPTNSIAMRGPLVVQASPPRFTGFWGVVGI